MTNFTRKRFLKVLVTIFSGFPLFFEIGCSRKTVFAQQAITPSTEEIGLIGIVIKQEDTGELITQNVLPSSPAAAAGILEGDIIIAINDVSTQEMTPEEAGALLRGNPNTSVSLSMERAGTREAYEVRPNRQLVPEKSALFGILIRQEEDTGSLVVEAVFPNSPAARAGVSEGSIIEAINGQSTEGMNSERAGELLRGEPDTEVTLRLQEPNSQRIFEVRSRREILDFN